MSLNDVPAGKSFTFDLIDVEVDGVVGEFEGVAGHRGDIAHPVRGRGPVVVCAQRWAAVPLPRRTARQRHVVAGAAVVVDGEVGAVDVDHRVVGKAEERAHQPGRQGRC